MFRDFRISELCTSLDGVTPSHLPSGHGMEWNGTEISVWNMQNAKMEWNGRFQEWNGVQSFILPYQFHTRFPSWHLQKNVLIEITKNVWKRLAAKSVHKLIG